MDGWTQGFDMIQGDACFSIHMNDNLRYSVQWANMCRPAIPTSESRLVGLFSYFSSIASGLSLMIDDTMSLPCPDQNVSKVRYDMCLPRITQRMKSLTKTPCHAITLA